MQTYSSSGDRRTIARAPLAPREQRSTDVRNDRTTLFNDLRTARRAFDINPTALQVLWALLNTHRGAFPALGDKHATAIVFASNARIAEWIGQVSEKTVTRSLNRLEAAGLVRRRPSPNGKRYARRTHDGEICAAFGIDIAPFFARAEDVREAARLARAENDEVVRLRARVLEMLARLANHTGDEIATLCAEARRELRRVGCIDALNDIAGRMRRAVTCRDETPSDKAQTDRSSVPARQRGRHIDERIEDKKEARIDDAAFTHAFPRLCGSLQKLCARMGSAGLPFALEEIAMNEGITPRSWRRTLKEAGQGAAMVSLGYLMQRQDSVRHAPAYFRRITQDIVNGRIRIEDLVFPVGKPRKPAAGYS